MKMKKQTSPGRALSLLLTLSLLLSLCVVPASAAKTTTAVSGVFENTSDDGGENMISLTNERTFKAMIPVNMTEEVAKEKAASAVWSLIPDETKDYLDDELFPNQTEGGADRKSVV